MRELLVLEPGGNPEELLGRLCALTTATSRLSPEGVSPLDGPQLLQGWPFPYQRPWILCGGEKQPPCLPDPNWCSDEWTRVEWDLAVSWLAENSEWALLSTFTTYHSNSLHLITSPKIASQILNNPGALHVEVVEHYPNTVGGRGLRNAVFCHDNEEGVHPWRLDSPCYLLCSLEDEICYQLWDEEAETDAREPWYLPYTSSLNLVREWTCRRWGLSYQLFRVDEWEPYRALWARTGQDEAVARATFSLDLDKEALQRLTQQNYGLSSGALKLANWGHMVLYGGGSDEHIAHFRSRDPQLTQRLWEMVEQSDNPFTRPLSRF